MTSPWRTSSRIHDDETRLAVGGHERDRGDAEAELLAQRGEWSDVAGPAVAEAVVLADDDSTAPALADQHLLGERLGREQGELVREGDHQQLVDALLRDQLGAAVDARERARRLAGAQDHGRHRLERRDGARHAELRARSSASGSAGGGRGGRRRTCRARSTRGLLLELLEPVDDPHASSTSTASAARRRSASATATRRPAGEAAHGPSLAGGGDRAALQQGVALGGAARARGRCARASAQDMRQPPPSGSRGDLVERPARSIERCPIAVRRSSAQ